MLIEISNIVMLSFLDALKIEFVKGLEILFYIILTSSPRSGFFYRKKWFFAYFSQKNVVQ